MDQEATCVNLISVEFGGWISLTIALPAVYIVRADVQDNPPTYLAGIPIAAMYFTLPNLPEICPFPSSFNPHFESVASESKTWIDSFGVLSSRQRRIFSTSAFELLAAHAYPYADREGYRTSCDYMNVTFLLDDYSDDEGRRGARVMADSFMKALRNPDRDDGTAFAKLARELVDFITPQLTSFTDHSPSSGSE